MASPELIAATQAVITTPAYFVLIDFSTPLRLSSRGDQSWNGQAWTGGRLGKVSASASGGQIELINSDLVASALVLGDGVADRAVSVWKFYDDNPAEADAVQVFTGVADTAEIGADRVRIKLVPENTRTLYSPRRFVNAAAGFTQLLPAGTQITWGGQTITLDRGA